MEARIPVQVYDQMQRAARLRGMTLTGYLLATAGEDARRAVEDADILRLAREDQIRFAQALIDPPTPNDRLKRAASRHRELIEPQ
ncbi:type II toxin-antitoxin system TacA family antitoxin [Sphingobium indicum]|uniref:type II toxin-antitoxin system TacA family antitoxin n=1 Tax=Sphingobium indicum TaxID=332055 RepID=UPI000308A877